MLLASGGWKPGDSPKHRTMHRTAPTAKIYRAQNANRAEVLKPWFKGWRGRGKGERKIFTHVKDKTPWKLCSWAFPSSIATGLRGLQSHSDSEEGTGRVKFVHFLSPRLTPRVGEDTDSWFSGTLFSPGSVLKTSQVWANCLSWPLCKRHERGSRLPRGR